jgi:hypothetical protein
MQESKTSMAAFLETKHGGIKLSLRMHRLPLNAAA